MVYHKSMNITMRKMYKFLLKDGFGFGKITTKENQYSFYLTLRRSKKVLRVSGLYILSPTAEPVYRTEVYGL